VGHWSTVAKAGEIANNGCKAVSLDGAKVAVYNLNGEYFAVEDICTHDGGELSSGWVEDGRAICPRHFAEFSIRTGEALNLPGHQGVHRFPVRVRDRRVEVRDDRK
jgi:3-phenylpropionate/trans-cinnamate dioxygenase ferredoxin subunit